MATANAPEPSSLLFLGTGFLALAFLAFRKVKPSTELVIQA
jgi:PEP-CTERM motif